MIAKGFVLICSQTTERMASTTVSNSAKHLDYIVDDPTASAVVEASLQSSTASPIGSSTASSSDSLTEVTSEMVDAMLDAKPEACGSAILVPL